MRKVSVVIPAYNAEKTIRRCLDALLTQSYCKGDYEIVVVDDGSVDGTRKTVERCQRCGLNYLQNIKLITQKHNGPACARNNGVRKAKGKILLFTDADCVVSENWINEMVKPIKGCVVGVQGRYRALNNDKIIARFIQSEIEIRYERTAKRKHIDFIGTYAAAYRRDVFEKLGGFDESFPHSSGEDAEFSFRVDAAGYKMVFNPKAIVYHSHPDTLKKFLRMKFYRGYWGNRLYEKHPEKRKGQSYNSIFHFLQVPLTGGLGLLCLLSIPFGVLYSSLFLIALFGITVPQTVNMARSELKFLVMAPVLITLKNVAIGFGVAMGKLRRRSK